MTRLHLVKKMGISLAALLFHCVSFAEGVAATVESSMSTKVRVGVAIVEPRLARDIAVPDVLVIGPLPINIERPPRPEIKSINVASEIERATCASLEQHLEQLSCIPFPVKVTLPGEEKSTGRAEAYKATLEALAKHNAALPPEHKVDTFLVLKGGQIKKNQIDEWGMFGVVLMQTANLLFQNTGYVPASFIAMHWEFYDATTMERLTSSPASALSKYDYDAVVAKDELPVYLSKFPANPKIEASIRKNIADACASIGKQLDLGLWSRFKNADPWMYIRKHGY